MDKKVLRNLSYGVYVVTSKENDKNVGCIANSIMQVTSNPCTIAVSVNHDNYTNKVIKENKKFGVSILKETSDPKIIGTFGFKSSKYTDKFSDVKFKEEDEIPVIEDSCGYMICQVVDIMETETHTVFLAEVKNADDYNNENPMTYKYYHEQLKGSSPKNAPTYEEKQVNDHGIREERRIAVVNSALCQGCGACTVACPSGAMDLQGFSNRQIIAEVDAICR